MKHFKAIAAMAENRVIGAGNRIPWHLPEDFKWFKKCTQGAIVVMGRKTFESLGKPLPGRRNFVLTRHPELLKEGHPELFGNSKTGSAAMSTREVAQMPLLGLRAADLRLFSDIKLINPNKYPCDVFIIGGAQVYKQMLFSCSDLYLTLVKRSVEGDALFPPFEHLFREEAVLRDTPEFKIIHYRRITIR
jgi:dihydrofolate reductase